MVTPWKMFTYSAQCAMLRTLYEIFAYNCYCMTQIDFLHSVRKINVLNSCVFLSNKNIVHGLFLWLHTCIPNM